MLAEPTCWTRKCKHYLGVKWFGQEESSENNYCLAFPKGIPGDIAYGDNLHLTKHPDQDGDLIYEPE